MAVLWIASIESSTAMMMNSFNLAFATAIWVPIPRGSVQFCQRGKYGVPTNGFNLPAGNVEYGVGQGMLPPVQKSWRSVPRVSGERR